MTPDSPSYTLNDVFRVLGPPGIDGLTALAESSPAQAAPIALAAAKMFARMHIDVGVRLLRAQPKGLLLAALATRECAHLFVRRTERPVPPDYRIEIVPLKDIAKTDDDVLAFVAQTGWERSLYQHCVWDRVSRGEIKNFEAHELQADPLKLDEQSEVVAEAVRRALWRTLGYLPPDALMEAITHPGGMHSRLAMFMDDTVAPLLARDDVRAPAIAMDLLERMLLRAPSLDTPHGTFSVIDSRLGKVLIEALAAAKHAPACPLLAALASCPTAYSGVKHFAVDALRAIGGPAALDSIDRALRRAIDESFVRWDPHHPTLFAGPMFYAMFAATDDDLFDRLAHYLAPETIAIDCGAQLAKDLLEVLGGSVGPHAHAVVRLLSPDRPAMLPVLQDPRWLDTLVRLLNDTRLQLFAKLVLKKADKLLVKEAKLRVEGPKKKRATTKPKGE